MQKTLLALLLLTVPACFAGDLSDWPQFRGPAGQGTSSDKGLPQKWSGTENIAWKVQLPGAGTSAPIVYRSHIYLTCYSGFKPGGNGDGMDQLKLHLVCLNRADGKPVWSKEIAPKLPEQPVIRDDHGYASSSVAVDAERIYTFFGKTGVIAFDHDGKQLWQADVGSKLNPWGSAASPVLFGELVIVNASVESDTLVALNKKDGKQVWSFPGVKDSWNTPVLVKTAAGKTELVFAIMGKVIGVDPATGKQLWTCATDIPWYMVPSIVADNGIVYCVGGRDATNGALAVRTGGSGDVTATHRLWKIKKGSNVTSPLYHDGHVYWMHENKGLAFCADAKTGNIVYEQKVMERIDQVYASPVLADGKIYYTTRGGKTFVVAAKPQYELLATNDFGERSTFNASPAVAGGKLYFRSDKTLYCIGK